MYIPLGIIIIFIICFLIVIDRLDRLENTPSESDSKLNKQDSDLLRSDPDSYNHIKLQQERTERDLKC